MKIIQVAALFFALAFVVPPNSAPAGAQTVPDTSPVAAQPSSGRVVMHSDFSALTQPVNNQSEARKVAITGALPPGWDEDSGWQEGAQIRYEPVNFTGRRGLTITPQRGTAQLKFKLPGFRGGARYRLRVVGRNPRQLEIKIGVRDEGEPYHAHWIQSLGFGDEWSAQTLDFALGEIKSPVGLYLFVSGPRGGAQISEITLTERTTQDILNDARRRYPGGGPQNLLRVTRLPLGLQSGWSVGNIADTPRNAYGSQRYVSLGEEAQVAPDTSTLGPSGAPALRLRLRPPADGDLIPVFAEPFGVARLDQPHTASVYLKGDGEGRIQVSRGYWTPLGETPFKVAAGDGWKRFEVPFAPGIEEAVWTLRVEAKGDLWMDALQVEPNPRATPYRSQLPFEVSLARPSGAAADAGISFFDEPMRFRWAVTGPSHTGARLRCKVVFVDGTTRDLPPIALSGAAFLRRGDASYNALAGKTLGAFRIEAQVEDGGGRPLSAPNELLMTRVRRPRFWGKDAPRSPFGTHLNNTTQNIRLAKAIGFNWVRLHDASAELVKWQSLEPERGKWNWNDPGIGKFRRQNISILGVAETTPVWAARAQGGYGYYDAFFLPRDWADWETFTSAVIGRYKNDISIWDVWNEPWGFGYLNVGVDTSASARGQYVRPNDEKAEYKRLSDGVRRGAEKAPGVRVTWDATRPLDWFMDRVREGSVRPGDIVDYHSYVGGAMGYPGDAARQDAEQVRQAIRDAGRPDLVERVQLWMTEGSPSPGRLFSGFYNVTLPATYKPEAPQTVIDNADQIVRYQASLLADGVDKIFLYSMGRESHFGKDQTRWAVHVMEDGMPHPSAAAQSVLAFHLEGKKPVGTREVAPGVWAFLFTGTDEAGKPQTVAVLSPQAGHGRYVPPAASGVRRVDLWGNPVAPGQAVGTRTEYVVISGPAARTALFNTRPQTPGTRK